MAVCRNSLFCNPYSCPPPSTHTHIQAAGGCTGNGANMAMVDAWELAQQLLSPDNSTLAEAVAKYDAESGPRSTQALMMGRRAIEASHQTGLRHLFSISFMWCLGLVIVAAQWWHPRRAQIAAWRLFEALGKPASSKSA